ncbi:unnamed protein product, partial [Staurois parvus]
MSVRLMERIWSGRSGISTAAVSEYRAGRSALQRDLIEMTADLWGGRGSGYLNLTGTRSHFRGVVLSSYPSAVTSVLSTVSGHPCAVRSLWSSPVLCQQSLVIP